MGASDTKILLARRYCSFFVSQMERTPSGDPYFSSWFNDQVCEACDLLVAHARGRSYGIRRALVQQPTQTGKSLHTSVVFPSRVAGSWPEAKVVIAGYGTDFMTRTLPDVVAVSNTRIWRMCYPDISLGKPQGDQGDKAASNTSVVQITRRDQSGVYRKTGGFIIARSMRGAISGNPMDVGIIEDPYKNYDDALSPLIADSRRSFFTGVFSMRQQSRRSVSLVSFSPWTPNDLGFFIQDMWEKEGEPYVVLKYPMLQRTDSEREIERWNASPTMRAGLARYLGVNLSELEALVKERGLRPYDERPLGMGLLPFRSRDQEFYEQRKRSTTPHLHAALNQMDPDTDRAERFPREAWRYFDPVGHRLDTLVVSLDTNAKATDDGSFSVFGVYDLHPVGTTHTGALDDPDPLLLSVDQGKPAHPWKTYRLDEVRTRTRYSELLTSAISVFDKWSEAKFLIIEDKAAGQSLLGDDRFIDALEERGVKIIPTMPGQSMHTRSDRAEVAQRNGYCFLPSASHGRITCEWIHDVREGDAALQDEGVGFLSEMTGGVKRDDRIAEFSQMIEETSKAGFSSIMGWDALGSLVF